MSVVPRITFLPGGEVADADEGALLLDIALGAGVRIPATCGGKGTCGDCAVRVVRGSLAEAKPLEAAALAGTRPDIRLSCLAEVASDAMVKPVAPVAVSGTPDTYEEGTPENE